ncbi:MAG: twin-arginine translocation signal domain-containing protein [Chloroflexota bacterium]
MSNGYSRRHFLRFAAAGAAGSLLAACQPKVVEKIVKETVVVTQEKQVTVVVEKEAKPAAPGKKTLRILLSSWAVGEIPFDKTAREFSDLRGDLEVKVQTTFEGWETKVIAQINDGTLEWSAAGILTPFLVMKQWVATKMVQPMDDYIAASKQEGAGKVLSDMIPSVKADGSFEGKFYSLAYSFENITYNWRVDYAKAEGATEAPATWDDWLKIALELKKWGANEKIYPTAFASALWTDIGALICSATTKPYTADGMIDWMAPEMTEALAFYKRLIVQEQLTPPHGGDGWLDAYYSGKVASVQAQSSRGVWGQNAFGTDKVATSPIPTKVKGGGAGSVYWGNGVAILNKAPMPQEACDYMVYTMGPQNTGFHQTVMKTGKTPIYNSSYEIIKTNPQYRTYEWMIGMREDAARSVVTPRNNYYLIQHTFWNKHRIAFTEAGSTMKPEEVAKLIMDDSKAEIAKQKL